MEQLLDLYNSMGVSSAVYNYGQAALENLKERFAEIDKIERYAYLSCYKLCHEPVFLPFAIAM